MMPFGNLAASDLLKRGGIAVIRKKFARIGSLLVLCLAAGLVIPLPATAAPPSSSNEINATDLDPAEATMIPEAELLATGCGSVCDGKNPATFVIYSDPCTGCYHYCADDATTVASNNSASVGLELRYSSRCRTAWARVISDVFYPTIRSYYLNGNVRTSYSGFAGSYYTMMVNDAGLLARAEASTAVMFYWTDKY